MQVVYKGKMKRSLFKKDILNTRTKTLSDRAITTIMLLRHIASPDRLFFVNQKFQSVDRKRSWRKQLKNLKLVWL